MQDTICALSTPQAVGAIALVRISGEEALSLASKVFQPKGGQKIEPRVSLFGEIFDGETVLDQVLFTYFHAPHSFTGEDMVEISCHGSLYIQKRLVELLIETGCRLANPGEFSMRSFVNGKMDLAQAEAVADLIASQSKAAHALAIKGLRGGFSAKIRHLREQLLHFAAMLELELDFAEEEVEFANREQFLQLIDDIKKEIDQLLGSFKYGNAIKNGIAVAIVGEPNVGKSTLLNVLLKEDRAIVSQIAGTTRDTVEDCITLSGFLFRFIDTAGLRKSDDEIEKIGIERSIKAAQKAEIILFVIDANTCQNVQVELQHLLSEVDLTDKTLMVIANKVDTNKNFSLHLDDYTLITVSAKEKKNIDLLEQHLVEVAQQYAKEEPIMVANLRQYQALHRAEECLSQARQGFEDHLSTDLIAVDIHQTLYHLGEVVGQVSHEEVLTQIFSRFCIGK